MFYDIYGSYPGFTGAIFGAGKRCAPQPTFLAWCNLFPESRLPRDVYGEGTDVVRDDLPVYDYEVSEHLHDDPSHPESFVYGRYEKVRPRYGNSGSKHNPPGVPSSSLNANLPQLQHSSEGEQLYRPFLPRRSKSSILRRKAKSGGQNGSVAAINFTSMRLS